MGMYTKTVTVSLGMVFVMGLCNPLSAKSKAGAVGNGSFPSFIQLAAGPEGVAVDKVGNVYVSISTQGEDQVWKFSPSGDVSFLASLGAPAGGVWYTGNAKGLIGRLAPKSGQITEFKVEGARDPHTPLWLNGKLWFTAQQANKYGLLDPKTGDVKVYDSPVPQSKPYGLQRAPDGTLWMALFGTNKLGHLDPATSQLATVDLPNADARPRRLAITADGRIWYSDYARGYLGMYDPKTKSAKEWKTPNQAPEHTSNPYGIGIAPDGAVWFNEARQGNMVRFDPRTEQMLVVEIPTKGSVIRNVTVDSARQRLWIAESGVSRLGRIDLR